MSFYSEMERIIKDQGEAGLEHLLYYFGLDLEVHRSEKSSVSSRIHGSSAGVNTKKQADITGLMVSDDFFPSDGMYSPTFNVGFLFTESDDVKAGDIIKVVPKDGKIRRYNVVGTENIGFTTEIFTKWKLSAIGD